ncbi:MAG: hypothetical protein JJU28_05845 [Cyclobacteriaceae bacterium]|nr:hypothetical protein [Cyclobacteriaceae bacterium]
MKDLKRLVRIVTKLKQRQYPLLELKSINENSSKENIFFRYIKKGMVNTDDEASELLYGTKSDDDRYRMLKSRLKQKLLNHLFFLEFSDQNQKLTYQYEQEVIQLLHQARMLTFTGEKRITKNLLLKALTQANRCEFTRHSIASLEELVRVYSDNCQPHLFENNIDELRAARALFLKEDQARETYYRMRMMIVKSVNSRKKNMELAEDAIRELEQLWKETKSYNVFDNYYRLRLLYMELTADFETIIPFLTEIQTGKYEGVSLNENRIDTRHITYSLIYAHFKSKKLQEGLDLAEKFADLFDSSSDSWFAYKETYFLLAMHSRDYRLAFEIISHVFDNKRFISLSAKAEERWKLYNAYLHFAYSGNFYMRSFNFTKYVENVPEYNKDKEGFNVAILILQFLYFVERADVDALSERRDALKKYMANHFKENFSYRTRTFYKLLNIVVENEMDMKKINAKSKYLSVKLTETPVVGDAYQELEIIPYEHLWELMMHMIRFERVSSWQ